MHLHTEEDLFYIQHYSPWLGLVILFQTRGRGSAGRQMARIPKQSIPCAPSMKGLE
jgi:hypothetical protein